MVVTLEIVNSDGTTETIARNVKEGSKIYLAVNGEIITAQVLTEAAYPTISANIDTAVGEFLAQLSSIDDYVRPEWELEIKQEIWERFEIDTPSTQSMFESKLAEIRNPIRRKDVD